MGKKVIATLLMMSMLMCGCGEGSGKPDGVSDEMYQSAVYAIKAVDLYLNAESTIEDMVEKIDNTLPDYDGIDQEYEEDVSVWTSINGLSSYDLAIKYGMKSISDLKNDRNDLAEKKNYKD